MVDQTIHLIDLARYIAGEAETVYAEYTERGRHIAEDRASRFDNWASYAVTIRFKNGVLGNLYSTYALYPDIFRSTAESVESDKATRESSVILDVICRELLIRYVHARETRVYRKGEKVIPQERCIRRSSPRFKPATKVLFARLTRIPTRLWQYRWVPPGHL